MVEKGGASSGQQHGHEERFGWNAKHRCGFFMMPPNDNRNTAPSCNEKAAVNDGSHFYQSIPGVRIGAS
jgi:hypothetical protein